MATSVGQKAPIEVKRVKGSAVVSLCTNLGIAACKVVAAVVSGSSAMLAEAAHSLVDTLNSVFLVIGERAGRKPADRTHPAGHGRETYFWTLVAAVSTLTGGGAVSLYEGITHLIRPHPIEISVWSYVVLGLAAPFDAVAVVAAYREYRSDRHRRGLWESFVAATDLTTYAVLFENLAALAGLVIASAGLLITQLTGSTIADAIASVSIGLVLAGVALLLARESFGLIIGESLDPRVERQMRAIAEGCPDVEEVVHVLSIQSGPHDVFVAMDVHFKPALSAERMADVVDTIESAVRQRYPDVKRIFLEADRIVEATRH
jgi:cation diffusion facilitator family transporter